MFTKQLNYLYTRYVIIILIFYLRSFFIPFINIDECIINHCNFPSRRLLIAYFQHYATSARLSRLSRLFYFFLFVINVCMRNPFCNGNSKPEYVTSLSLLPTFTFLSLTSENILNILLHL
jgi:hypothetical protein